MTDREAGYLKALKDVQDTVRQMVNDLGSSPEGKVDLLGVVSFLADLIKAKEGRQDDDGSQEAPDPLSGSF